VALQKRRNLKKTGFGKKNLSSNYIPKRTDGLQKLILAIY
jgi:hypothetical protein